MNQLLEDRTTVIYGAAGGIGSAVARTFAREGATVYLAGRTASTLEALAAQIVAEGGRAHAAPVDALDEAAVDAHADAIAAEAGGIDVSLNLVKRGDAQGTPLVDMAKDDFLRAIVDGASTCFLTARAAARHMVPQGSGVILHLTSGSARGAAPGMGSTGPADAATDTFMRYLAAELGPSGIRVVGIHTAGVAETLTSEAVSEVLGGRGAPPAEEIVAAIARMTMLGRAPAVQQIADTAAFLASDRAGAITSGMINATCGLIAG